MSSDGGLPVTRLAARRGGLLACVFAATVALCLPTMALAADPTPDADGGEEKTRLRVGMQGQLRFRAGPAADDPATGVDEGQEPAVQEIVLQRLRLRVRARHEDYVAKMTFAVDRGKPRLLTGSLRRDLGRHLHVEVGQTKRLLAQAYIDGSAHQRLIERPRLTESFAGERDIGTVLTLQSADRRMQAHIAAWNGAGPNVVGNRTGAILGEVRLDLQLFDRLDLEQPTIGKRLAVRLGVAGAAGRRAAERSDNNGLLTRYDETLAASGALAVRFARVEWRTEALWTSAAPVDARTVRATPLDLSTVAHLGLYSQLAVQPAKRWQLAVRGERHHRDRDDPSAVDDILDVGITYRPKSDDRRKLQIGWQHRWLGRPLDAVRIEDRFEMQLQWML